MKLDQVMRKGHYIILRIDEDAKPHLRRFGFTEGSPFYLTSISSCGYRIVVFEQRCIALPMWVCRGIEL